MGYIGNTPAEKYITLSKQTFTPDSSTVAFTLDNPVANENELAVFVNNVRQEPGSGRAYTATGTTLTMSEAPTSGDTMYAIYLGKTMATNTPADGSVTNDMLSGSIATSKLADGSTFATTNGITEMDMWRVTTNFTNAGNGVDETITANWERADVSFEKIGTGLTESSGVFSFASTGKYLISALASYYPAGANSNIQFYSEITTDNGSSYSTLALALSGAAGADRPENVGFNYICDVTETTNTKIRFGTVGATNITWQCNTNSQRVGFTCIRLGDT